MSFKDEAEIRCPCCFSKGDINPAVNRIETDSFHSYSRVYVCGQCRNKLDRDFVENSRVPVLSIGMIGFAGQGKTRYLQSLLSLFGEKQRNEKEWKHFQVTPCNEEARNGLYEVFESKREWGKKPFTLALFQIAGMPYLGNRFVAIYDPHDGNLFTQSLKIREKAYYLSHCNLLFFMIDIAKNQREKNPKENLRKLLDILLLEQVLPENPMFVLLLASETADNSFADFWNYLKTPLDFDPIARIEADSQRVKQWFINQNNEYKAFANVLENQFSSNRVAYALHHNTGACLLTPLLWGLKS